MVNYNPKDWLSFIFKFHKSDTFRKLLPAMFAMAIYAYAVAYLEINYYQLSENHQLKNINIVHSLMGFVISMLLVSVFLTRFTRIKKRDEVLVVSLSVLLVSTLLFIQRLNII